MSSVVASWTRLIVDHARRCGVDVAPVLARHGLDEASLARPGARVPARTDDRVWAELSEAIGDDDLGVHLAEGWVSASSFGVVGFLARASDTVGDAIAQAQRWQRLVKDDNHIGIVRGPRGATVTEMPGPERGAWPRAVAEAILANYVALARAWSGAPIAPIEVRFQHAAPRDTRELERFFAVRPKFGQHDNALVIGHDAMATPLATAETALVDLLEAVAAEQEGTLGARAFADDVRLAVDALLATDPSIERVARRLALSPRSVQRRLAAEGVTFRDVVDRVRLDRALALARGRTPAAEIAARLGFSDARAFRRAYQRWTTTAAARRA